MRIPRPPNVVRRGIKPAIFEVTIDGKLVDQDAAVRDYQKRFEEDVLGFNLNSFRQIVRFLVAVTRHSSADCWPAKTDC